MDPERSIALVSLPTTPLAPNQPTLTAPFRGGREPHPEIYMTYISAHMGRDAWGFQVVEALYGMQKPLATPFIIFYPTASSDLMPFPVNKHVRNIQGKLPIEHAWCGDLVVAKYKDTTYSEMIDASMADYPIIKNFLFWQAIVNLPKGEASAVL
ncbi:hypothetical protein BV20DRAFT_1054678 [Pilatotrama ljubarskyi]|nr:hypothetical protein BV20DRAFT_1054678 [Pilatotrama ljubarskyi]